jgi:4-hydroxy-2-oxoheptanedioate aldolase
MLTEQIRQFKKKLKEGYVLGPFAKTCDPAFIEIMGYGGFDFVIIDLEHGPNSVQTAQDLVRAAQVSHIFPIIRVKEQVPSVIGEALDIGAGGIHVPQITSAEDARSVVERAKFAPEGMRGVCRFVRAGKYSSMDRFRYFKEANEAVIIVALEGTEAIEKVDEIISVDGIDIVFVGSYDLSQSLGVTGQIDHPMVTDKLLEIIEKCLPRGIAVGSFVETVEGARKWRDLGVKYLCYSVDTGIYYQACHEIVVQARRD